MASAEVSPSPLRRDDVGHDGPNLPIDGTDRVVPLAFAMRQGRASFELNPAQAPLTQKRVFVGPQRPDQLVLQFAEAIPIDLTGVTDGPSVQLDRQVRFLKLQRERSERVVPLLELPPQSPPVIPLLYLRKSVGPGRLPGGRVVETSLMILEQEEGGFPSVL